MAADFIIVNTAKSLGAKVVAAANQLVALRALVDQLVAVANHQNDGTSYAMVESQFGLQAGAGANFVTLLNVLDGILVGNSGAGGATQQAQILEFCSRLSGQ